MRLVDFLKDFLLGIMKLIKAILNDKMSLQSIHFSNFHKGDMYDT